MRTSIIFLVISGFGLPCFAICPSADLTGDCVVNFNDFAIFAEWWMKDCKLSNNFCDGTDIDLSSRVDENDLADMAAEWLDDTALAGDTLYGL